MYHDTYPDLQERQYALRTGFRLNKIKQEP
jgi:hypothetical protein